MGNTRIENILVSVSDKQGVDDFLAKILTPNMRVFASDGTYALLKQNKHLPEAQLQRISDYIANSVFQEKVKTIDFKLYAGILADDKEEFYRNFPDGVFFDMVICNLYAFETAMHGVKDIDAICKFIDIGGVTLLRAAAKNFKLVCALSNPRQYNHIAEELNQHAGISLATRYRLCQEAFALTAQYDKLISEYFNKHEFTSFFGADKEPGLGT